MRRYTLCLVLLAASGNQLLGVNGFVGSKAIPSPSIARSLSLVRHSTARRGAEDGRVALRARVSAPVKTGGNDDGKRDDAVQLPWPPKSNRVKNYSLMPGEVAVRFINAPGRYPSDGTNDIIAAAKVRFPVANQRVHTMITFTHTKY